MTEPIDTVPTCAMCRRSRTVGDPEHPMADLTRAALIEAAAKALDCGGRPCAMCRQKAVDALDAVLPLIADAIAKLAPYNCELNPHTGAEDALTSSWVEGIHDAHDLVRSLRGDDGE